MDRGYRKGLRLEPDRKSRKTWLGLLIGSWLFLAMLAWLDPFGPSHRGYDGPKRDPKIVLIVPQRGDVVPRGMTLSPDGRGQRFVYGDIARAPVRYGTYDELMRSSFFAGGPQTLLEALGPPGDGEVLLGDIGQAVRVVPVAMPGRGGERLITVDAVETSMVDPSRAGRLVLARGCLRLDRADGPLAILSRRAGNVFVDDQGWLAAGALSGADSLRIGEEGVIRLEPVIDDAPAIRSLRLRCGGNEAVVQIAALSRTPVCDLTAAQLAENRAGMSEQQAAVDARMRDMRAEQIAACTAQGRDEAVCQRSIPPMPPPPMDFAALPHQGRGPGEACLAREDLPPGAWSPARDQPS